MGGDYEDVERCERRKEDVEVGQRLARIEILLDSLKEQLPARLEDIKEQIFTRFESIENRQVLRENECDEIRESIVKIRIDLSAVGTKVGVGSVLGSAILATAIAYFTKR